jgi:adenylate kinase family enzyme
VNVRADDLPSPRRVVVVGVSGSGKSTLARALSDRFGVPHVELDALYHQPNWTELPDDEFEAAVADATAGEEWVVDGNYSRSHPVVLPRATAVVWIDLPRGRATLAVLGRTWRRVLTREPMWNGNRERWWTVLQADHPIRWSWSSHPRVTERYTALFADPELTGVTCVRLRSRREIATFLAPRPGPPTAVGRAI